MTKTHRIQTVITLELKSRLEKTAKLAGLELNDFIRVALSNSIPKTIQKEKPKTLPPKLGDKRVIYNQNFIWCKDIKGNFNWVDEYAVNQWPDEYITQE